MDKRTARNAGEKVAGAGVIKRAHADIQQLKKIGSGRMWIITLAVQREIIVSAENVNDAVSKAKEQKTDEEQIVNIRLEK